MSDNIVYSGFFNRASGESDRLYNAQHFSKFFDGLICDGVYVNFPQDEDDQTEKAFYVKATSGMGIKVAKGRAWFLGTYTYTEADCTFTLDQTVSSLQSRIDAVVLDVNVGDAVRMNDIVIVKGTEGTTPDRPTLINEPTHKQFPIAFIRIPGGATSILQSNITQTVGTDDEDAIPAVEALLEIASKSKKELQDQINAIKTPTFTEAETVANINSGDNINTIWGKIKKMFSTIINKLPVVYGGTGKSTFTSNAVLLGNGTNAVKEKASLSGAFYSSGNNNEPQFGTLPMNLGGTGVAASSVSELREALGVADASTAASITYVNGQVETLQTNFQAGVDTIYNATRNAGVTPSSSTPTDCATAIGNLRKTPYVDTYIFPENDTGETKTFSLPHTYGKVNANNVYNKGYRNAELRAWTEELYFGFPVYTRNLQDVSNSRGGTFRISFDVKNIISLTIYVGLAQPTTPYEEGLGANVKSELTQYDKNGNVLSTTQISRYMGTDYGEGPANVITLNDNASTATYIMLNGLIPPHKEPYVRMVIKRQTTILRPTNFRPEPIFEI